MWHEICSNFTASGNKKKCPLYYFLLLTQGTCQMCLVLPILFSHHLNVKDSVSTPDTLPTCDSCSSSAAKRRKWELANWKSPWVKEIIQFITLFLLPDHVTLCFPLIPHKTRQNKTKNHEVHFALADYGCRTYLWRQLKGQVSLYWKKLTFLLSSAIKSNLAP